MKTENKRLKLVFCLVNCFVQEFIMKKVFLRIFICFLCLICLANLNALGNNDSMGQGKDIGITVHLSEKVRVNDSLFIILESFSHKRPIKGGTTKSTAHLVVSKGSYTEKISLSKHGVEGKTDDCDGVSDNERYDSINCFGYTIKLRELVYNQSVTIKIEDVKKP